MTPKQKAFDLIVKFQHPISEESDSDCLHIEVAKEFALIAVNEMIQEVYNISHQYTAIYDEKTEFYSYTQSKELKFWLEVKQEIEKL